MINPKLLHNLAWIPTFLIGLCSCIPGIIWLTGGVGVVSRFFGLSLLALGLMICAYVLITFMGTTRSRNTIMAILGIILVILFYLEYTFIPIPLFVKLTYGFLALYLVSLWASFLLNREEKGRGRN